MGRGVRQTDGQSHRWGGGPVRRAWLQLEEVLSGRQHLRKGTGQNWPKADAFALSCPFRPCLRHGLQPFLRCCRPLSTSNQACRGPPPQTPAPALPPPCVLQDWRPDHSISPQSLQKIFLSCIARHRTNTFRQTFFEENTS